MDAMTRQVLDVLGDGGTTDMARRVIAWLGDPLRPEDLAGVTEVAHRYGVTKAAVSNWTASGIAVPLPLTRLAMGPVWSLKDWQRIRPKG